TLDRQLARLEDTLAKSEARDGAHVLVEVLFRLIAAHRRHDVLRHELALANGVLCVRNAVAADSAARPAWYRTHLAGSPALRHDLAVFGDEAKVGADTQSTALLNREVGAAHYRVRHDPGRPHDGV